MSAAPEGPETAATATLDRQQALYLLAKPDPVFAVLHRPADGASKRLAIVLCPPFGWEELCAHRSYLYWANAFADAGYPALRLDLPGSGESGGSPLDPGRVKAWTGAVAAAAGWLRSGAECERIVALGVGLGGMIACLAVADGAPVDDLVLWSVPARGHAIVRGLRAFAQISVVTETAPAPPGEPTLKDGSLEVAGFVLSAETLAQLEQIDLAAREIPDASARRVLLLGRDTVAADAALQKSFERSGASVTVLPGSGYEAMLSHPQYAQIPHTTFEETIDWLASSPLPDAPAPRRRRRAAVRIASQVELTVGELVVRETPFEFGHEGARLRGVLVEPSAASTPPPICALLLNAGAIRRIGPNRMWVEASRRWAALGVPTLRLDGFGIGDSDGDELVEVAEFYAGDGSAQLTAALDALSAHGLGDRFLLAGVCSGAYWGFHTTLSDERVHAAILVSLAWFFWNEDLGAARLALRARQLRESGELWRSIRQALGDGTLLQMLGTVVRHPRRIVAPAGEFSAGGDLDRALAELERRDVQTTLVLTLDRALEQSLIADERLEEAESWPGFTLERVPIHYDGFRPVWVQRSMHAALDRAVTRALEGSNSVAAV